MRRYLLVDDNVEFAENLAEILEEAGATVDLAADGQQALDRLTQHSYDALISDMKMPRMTGAELIGRARTVDPGVPAIVVTAYTTDAELVAARRQGLVAVLSKPVPIAYLVDIATAARRDGLVAVVEDDAALADNVTEALAIRGFGAVKAMSVGETEQIADLSPFAGLVDVRIPGGPDGMALTRLREKFPGLPVVVMTAHHDATVSEPVETILRKPFNTAALLDLLERLHAHSTRR